MANACVPVGDNKLLELLLDQLKMWRRLEWRKDNQLRESKETQKKMMMRKILRLHEKC